MSKELNLDELEKVSGGRTPEETAAYLPPHGPNISKADAENHKGEKVWVVDDYDREKFWYGILQDSKTDGKNRWHHISVEWYNKDYILCSNLVGQLGKFEADSYTLFAFTGYGIN